MRLAILLLVVLMLGVFCGAELGDEWDSFDGGNDSGGSSVGVDVRTESPIVDDVVGDVNETSYTLDFYVALGVGGFGVLVVAIFVYFFLRKPKNRWKKGS